LVGAFVGDFVGAFVGAFVGDFVGGGVSELHTPQVTGQKSLISLSGAKSFCAFKLHLLILLNSPSPSIQPWVQDFESLNLKMGSSLQSP
jgi:hypothetical protein